MTVELGAPREKDEALDPETFTGFLTGKGAWAMRWSKKRAARFTVALLCLGQGEAGAKVHRREVLDDLPGSQDDGEGVHLDQALGWLTVWVLGLGGHAVRPCAPRWSCASASPRWR